MLIYLKCTLQFVSIFVVNSCYILATNFRIIRIFVLIPDIIPT